MNTTTRRHPRTLSEAFGPYERGGLYVKPDSMHPHDRIVITASALVFVALIAVLFFWR